MCTTLAVLSVRICSVLLAREFHNREVGFTHISDGKSTLRCSRCLGGSPGVCRCRELPTALRDHSTVRQSAGRHGRDRPLEVSCARPKLIRPWTGAFGFVSEVEIVSRENSRSTAGALVGRRAAKGLQGTRLALCPAYRSVCCQLCLAVLHPPFQA